MTAAVLPLLPLRREEPQPLLGNRTQAVGRERVLATQVATWEDVQRGGGKQRSVRSVICVVAVVVVWVGVVVVVVGGCVFCMLYLSLLC